MSNLKVLGYNQAFMAMIGINSHRLTDPTNEFFSSFMSYFILLNGIIFTTVSSSVFAFTHLSHIQIALETFLIVIAGMQSCGMFLSVGLKMKKIKLLHLKLQAIVDKGNFGRLRPSKGSLRFIFHQPTRPYSSTISRKKSSTIENFPHSSR